MIYDDLATQSPEVTKSATSKAGSDPQGCGDLPEGTLILG
jgi:hypothetical protein